MEFITDRTEADVLLGNAKGRYRFTDLNRVERAVQELCNLGNQLGYELNLPTKTDWGPPGMFPSDSWPTDSQMKRYLSNVSKLCELFSVDSSNVPQTADALDWQGANAIEEALLLVYQEIKGRQT